MKIVFFGSSKYVIPIIEALQENFDLALVVTTEKNPTDTVPSYCSKNKINYISVSTLSDQNLKSQILNLKSEVAVLADFGLIIPKEILNAFPKGIINIHPSLLPKYRGPTPVQTAILNGEKETGVTIIKLDSEIDHGPILAQVKETIFESDTSESLYQRLFQLGSSLIVSTIELYIKGEIKPKEQNDKRASFTNHLSRQDGFIGIDNPPSPEALKRMINAYYPWPSVWTKVQIATSNKQQLTTYNKLGVSNQKLEVRIKFLPRNLIQVEGKKPVSYKDFMNGYPNLSPVMLNLFQHLERNQVRLDEARS